MRVKRGTVSKRRHNRLKKRAEGFRGRRKSSYKLTKRAVQKALQYAYRDRRVRKRDFRSLWITRINAALRASGVSYSKFIYALKVSKVELDRKALANLALEEPAAFQKLVQQVCEARA